VRWNEGHAGREQRQLRFSAQRRCSDIAAKAQRAPEALVNAKNPCAFATGNRCCSTRAGKGTVC
jgi:hypothetical protein